MVCCSRHEAYSALLFSFSVIVFVAKRMDFFSFGISRPTWVKRLVKLILKLLSQANEVNKGLYI